MKMITLTPTTEQFSLMGMIISGETGENVRNHVIMVHVCHIEHARIRTLDMTDMIAPNLVKKQE